METNPTTKEQIEPSGFVAAADPSGSVTVVPTPIVPFANKGSSTQKPVKRAGLASSKFASSSTSTKFTPTAPMSSLTEPKPQAAPPHPASTAQDTVFSGGNTTENAIGDTVTAAPEVPVPSPEADARPQAPLNPNQAALKATATGSYKDTTKFSFRWGGPNPFAKAIGKASGLAGNMQTPPTTPAQVFGSTQSVHPFNFTPSHVPVAYPSMNLQQTQQGLGPVQSFGSQMQQLTPMGSSNQPNPDALMPEAANFGLRQQGSTAQQGARRQNRQKVPGPAAELQKQLETIEKELTTAKNSLSVQERLNSTAQRRITDLRDDVQDLRTESTTHRNNWAAENKAKEDLTAELAKTNGEKKKLTEDVQEHLETISSLRLQVTGIGEGKVRELAEKDALISAANEKVTEVEDSKVRELAEKDALISAANEKVTEVEDSKVRELAEKDTLITAANQTITQLNSDLVAQRLLTQQAQQAMRATNTEVEKLKGDLEDNKNEMVGLKAEMGEMRVILAKLMKAGKQPAIVHKHVQNAQLERAVEVPIVTSNPLSDNQTLDGNDEATVGAVDEIIDEGPPPNFARSCWAAFIILMVLGLIGTYICGGFSLLQVRPGEVIMDRSYQPDNHNLANIPAEHCTWGEYTMFANGSCLGLDAPPVISETIDSASPAGTMEVEFPTGTNAMPEDPQHSPAPQAPGILASISHAFDTPYKVAGWTIVGGLTWVSYEYGPSIYGWTLTHFQ